MSRSLLLAFTITFTALLLVASPTIAATPEKQTELLIDAIVASVDGKPITLRELRERFPRARTRSLSELHTDAEAQEALDAIIMERLVLADAEEKRVVVTDQDVAGYITEVQRRNHLTEKDFEKALSREGKTLEKYKQEVRIEIMRSKLAGQFVLGSVTVSEEELGLYLKDHPQVSSEGAKLKLSQILIATGEKRSLEEARSRTQEVLKAIEDDDDSFAEIAQKYSDSSDAAEGGTLGIIAEHELSPAIFDAVFGLESGALSKPIETQAGIQIFKVEERFAADSGDNSTIREEIRKLLRKQKTEERLYTYFSQELPKRFAVERKL